MGGGAQVRTAIATKRTRARLVDLQAQRPDDRGPARELVVHVAPVRFGIEIAMRLERAGDQQLPVVAVGQQRKIRLSDLVDDRFGVPVGANTPTKFGATRSAKPCSTAVGSSGAAARRVPWVTARTLSLPARCSSSTMLVMAGTIMGIW